MKKYIITDPCYIMHDVAYRILGEVLGWSDFPTALNALTPIKLDEQRVKDTKHGRLAQHQITIHAISETYGGDGSMDYEDYHIGVDAGMLCIAESPIGWATERYGAKFETLEEAQKAFEKILAMWNKDVF